MNMPRSTKPNSVRAHWWWLVLLLALIVAMWAAYAYIVSSMDHLDGWTERGTFGDMFGGLNTLFAGLAFAGLIYAIFLQSQELALQRLELEETRQELERTATAQELTTSILREQLTAQRAANDRESFLRLLSIMEETRRDREAIWEHVKMGVTWSQLNGSDRAKLDRVCRAFDTLGLFDRLNLVDQRLIDQFYSPPFVRLYEEFLREYVEYIRSSRERGPTHYWELVRFYERAKLVPMNHPALLGLEDWPKAPRDSTHNSFPAVNG